MADPIWIDSANLALETAPQYCGIGTHWGPWPWTGALYCALADSGVGAPPTSTLRIYKSVDSGYTWTEQDGVNRVIWKLALPGASVALRYSGSGVVHIAYCDPVAGNIRLKTFDFATDTYSAEFGAAGSPVPSLGNVVGVVCLPSGDIRVFYTLLTGGFAPIRICWAKYSAGAWGAFPNVVFTAPGPPFYTLYFAAGAMIVEPGGKLHLFYGYTTPGVWPLTISHYCHRTLTDADVLSPAQPPLYDDGGCNNRLTNAFINAVGDLKVCVSISPGGPGWFCPGVATGVPAGDAPVWTVVTVNNIPGEGEGESGFEYIVEALDGTFHIWWLLPGPFFPSQIWHAVDSGLGWGAADLWYDEAVQPPLPAIPGYDPTAGGTAYTSVTVYPNSTTYGAPFGVMLGSGGVPPPSALATPFYLAFAPAPPPPAPAPTPPARRGGQPRLAQGGTVCPNAEAAYKTPPGYQDRYYVYAYNADQLVDGLDYRQLLVQVDPNHDFIMRKVSGGPQVARTPALGPPVGRLQFYNSSMSPVSAGPLNANHYRSAAVVPELRYPAGYNITFDLYGVLRAVHVAGVSAGGVTFLSQLAFHGVKRTRGEPDTASGYRYYEKPYIYHCPFQVNWLAYSFDAAGLVTGVEPPRQFYLEITHCDFELHAIHVFTPNTGLFPGAGAGPMLVRTTLYDQNERACSNIPLWGNYLADNAPDSFGNVITPPLLYRVGSRLMVDIHSLCLLADLPYNLEIDLVGIRRPRC
jgi:hypothetical protein